MNQENGLTARTAWLGIGLYCLLVTALAWIGRSLEGGGASPGIGFVVWGASPLAAALLLRLIFRDWRDLGAALRIKANAAAYVLALIAVPAAAVVSVVVGGFASASAFNEFDAVRYGALVAQAATPFFVFAIFEEFGWRGYLWPKLEMAGVGPLAASLAVGGVWAIWHIPFVMSLPWFSMKEDFAVFFPRFFVACIALSFLYGQVRSATGSVWPAVIMHATGNIIGHPLEAEFMTIRPGAEFLGAVGTSVEAIAVYALIGVAIYWHRRMLGAQKRIWRSNLKKACKTWAF